MERADFMAICEEAFEIHQQSPYGDMWRKFSPSELLSAAAYKTRRGTLLDPSNPKILDDSLDALNFIVFAISQIKGKESTSKEFVRYEKYEVMKLDDMDKYLTSEQRKQLDTVIGIIQAGRVHDNKVPCNRYVVVNEDMPYAEQVWKLIEEGELEI